LIAATAAVAAAFRNTEGGGANSEGFLTVGGASFVLLLDHMEEAGPDPETDDPGALLLPPPPLAPPPSSSLAAADGGGKSPYKPPSISPVQNTKLLKLATERERETPRRYRSSLLPYKARLPRFVPEAAKPSKCTLSTHSAAFLTCSSLFHLPCLWRFLSISCTIRAIFFLDRFATGAIDHRSKDRARDRHRHRDRRREKK
jgi:hypothetical protein